jgi:hypothetical protein
LTAAEQELPIFSATILDFEMIVEGIYILPKETLLHFGYAGIVLAYCRLHIDSFSFMDAPKR